MKWMHPTPCPISYTPPFGPPFRRELHGVIGRRLVGWCEALLPNETVEIVEWVGTDPQQPLHAVVVSFPLHQRPPVVLYMKVEDVRCHHLHQVLGTIGQVGVHNRRHESATAREMLAPGS